MGSMCCTAEPAMALENEDSFAMPEDPLRNKFGSGRSGSKGAEADALSASDGGLGSSTEADDAATPAHKPDGTSFTDKYRMSLPVVVSSFPNQTVSETSAASEGGTVKPQKTGQSHKGAQASQQEGFLLSGIEAHNNNTAQEDTACGIVGDGGKNTTAGVNERGEGDLGGLQGKATSSACLSTPSALSSLAEANGASTSGSALSTKLSSQNLESKTKTRHEVYQQKPQLDRFESHNSGRGDFSLGKDSANNDQDSTRRAPSSHVLTVAAASPDHGDSGKSEYNNTEAAVTHKANHQVPSKISSPGTTDGAYLIYSPENEGSFFVLWRKEAVPNALIFAKPKEGIRIPPFKYRGQSEVARLLHRSKKSAVEGIRQFLRTMQPFQSEVQLLERTDPEIRVPNVVLFAHTKDDTIIIGDSEGSFISLPDTDVIGLCLSGTQGEGALRSLCSNEAVSLETFQQRCKQYTEHIYLVSLGPVEL